MLATMKSYNTLSDDELWSLLNGNSRRAALSVLYQRYYELLYNYGMKCYTDSELIKDCIQDVFVKLHQGKYLAPNVTVRAYLLRAFHNAFLDQLANLDKNADEFPKKGFKSPMTKTFSTRFFH